jgi:hypothetical protein
MVDPQLQDIMFKIRPMAAHLGRPLFWLVPLQQVIIGLEME